MLKKIFFSVFVLAVLGLSVFSVVVMYQDKNSYTANVDSSKINDIAINTDDQWIVRRGNIERVWHFTGNVVPADDRALIHVNVDDKNAEICVSTGVTINVGDTVYKSSSGDYIAKTKMKCIKITSSSEMVITFLNYEYLYIEAQIPYECIEYDLLNSSVILTMRDYEFKGKFRYIDYINNHGNVYAEIEFDNSVVCLYPGSEVSVNFVAEQKNNVLLIPLAFVISKGEGEYKAQILDDGKIHYQAITLGVIGDDMAEITSGLDENTVLICPDEEDSLLFNMNTTGK